MRDAPLGLVFAAPLTAVLVAGCPDRRILDAIDDPCVEPVEVTVARVLDGDTFDTESPVDLGSAGQVDRFRMLCIDTPETGDCYHDEATEQLRERIEGEQVTLYFDEDCTGAYDRGLVHVFKGGRSINLQLARDGWTPLIEEYFREYASCEPILEAAQDACDRDLGGWGECDGYVPWDECPE